MSLIFTCIFFDNDPTKSYQLRQAARAAAQKLGPIVEATVKSTSSTGIISSIVDTFLSNNSPALHDYGAHMIRRLLDSGLDASEVTWSQILPTAVAMVSKQALFFTVIMDYYLSPAGAKHLPIIHRLAKENTPGSDEQLLRYCMEAIRLHGTFGSYRESRTTRTFDDAGRRVQVNPGDKIFVSFVCHSYPTLSPFV